MMPKTDTFITKIQEFHGQCPSIDVKVDDETAIHLFSSSVDSNSTSSRKQKTGYCRPSSLSRSTFILRLNFCRRAAMIPISVVLWSPRVTCTLLLHITVKHMTSYRDCMAWEQSQCFGSIGGTWWGVNKMHIDKSPSHVGLGAYSEPAVDVVTRFSAPEASATSVCSIVFAGSAS